MGRKARAERVDTESVEDFLARAPVTDEEREQLASDAHAALEFVRTLRRRRAGGEAQPQPPAVVRGQGDI